MRGSELDHPREGRRTSDKVVNGLLICVGFGFAAGALAMMATALLQDVPLLRQHDAHTGMLYALILGMFASEFILGNISGYAGKLIQEFVRAGLSRIRKNGGEDA